MYSHHPASIRKPELVMLDAKYDNKSLFDVIYDFAVADNKVGLQKLMAEGHGLQLRVYHSQYFHTPASLLAARGKHSAVGLLFELEIGTLDSIVYGYAISRQKAKVEEWLAIGGSLNAALCGYVARRDSIEKILINNPVDPDAKHDFISATKHTNNLGYDLWEEDLLNRGASLNVAVMAYAKAVKTYAKKTGEPNIGYTERVQGLLARGASIKYAMYGYSQRVAMTELNGLSKRFTQSNENIFWNSGSDLKSECYYRMALRGGRCDSEEDLKAYKDSIARGYAQANIEWEVQPDPYLPDKLTVDKIRGYAINGRSKKVNELLATIDDDWLRREANPEKEYVHGGNFKLAEANGNIYLGRNLFKATDCIQRASRDRISRIFRISWESDDQLRDFIKEVDLPAIAGMKVALNQKSYDFVFPLYKVTDEVTKQNSLRMEFFLRDDLFVTDRAKRMRELKSELKLPIKLERKVEEIKLPPNTNFFHWKDLHPVSIKY